MANYRKLKVNEVGTDTYVDYEANVSEHWPKGNGHRVSPSSINVCHVPVLSTQVRIFPLTGQQSSSTVNDLACFVFEEEDLCAISYDNGNIRLYSTYNNHLKLVKGELLKTCPVNDANGRSRSRLEFTCHCQCIFAIAWISDRLLCATSGDQTTVIYDIETGEEIDLLRGHTMSVRSVCKLQCSTRKSFMRRWRAEGRTEL